MEDLETTEWSHSSGGNHFFWDKKGLGDELLLQAQIQKDSLSI